MTLRLDDEQAAELDAIARIENVPVAEEVRRALAAHIAGRRKDRLPGAAEGVYGEKPGVLRRLATD